MSHITVKPVPGQRVALVDDTRQATATWWAWLKYLQTELLNAILEQQDDQITHQDDTSIRLAFLRSDR